jgi:hypothetical protein
MVSSHEVYEAKIEMEKKLIKNIIDTAKKHGIIRESLAAKANIKYPTFLKICSYDIRYLGTTNSRLRIADLLDALIELLRDKQIEADGDIAYIQKLQTEFDKSDFDADNCSEN